FFLQDAIRLFESIWRNAFNLVYPTIDILNKRYELTATIDIPLKSVVVIAAALLMLWGLWALVNRTRIGTAIRAVAEDQAAASLMGINVNRSEERRVGKECRGRWSPYREKEKSRVERPSDTDSDHRQTGDHT